VTSLHVLARVADERYAFAVEAVREVAESFAVTPVPGAPATLLGVHSLRGEILPVLDLAAILGVGRGAGGWLVVAEQGGLRAGLAVDAVEDVAELGTALAAEAEPLAGSVLMDGELVAVVDVGAVLSKAARGGTP
jgi:chemotaxis signal transduction protein